MTPKGIFYLTKTKHELAIIIQNVQTSWGYSIMAKVSYLCLALKNPIDYDDFHLQKILYQ